MKLIEAKYIKDYLIHCKFDNEESGTVDLLNCLWGEMFEPLKSIERFRDFHISEISDTIEWSNGADLAPEFLYKNLQ